MGYLGEEIRKLGFGLMRLPQKDGVIDVEQVKEMVDLFMEAGFTYFDTAWAYAGSHRRSTIKNSDCIMVLEQGRIIERGNHDQLMEEKGTYYKLQTGSNE